MAATKWKYQREELTDLTALDSKLSEFGDQGWELVTILHTAEADSEDPNILLPEKWVLILKQPA